jgi:hypothetical protein
MLRTSGIGSCPAGECVPLDWEPEEWRNYDRPEQMYGVRVKGVGDDPLEIIKRSILFGRAHPTVDNCFLEIIRTWDRLNSTDWRVILEYGAS